MVSAVLGCRDLTQRKPKAELHVVFGFNSVAGKAIHKLPLERKKGRQRNKEDYYLFGCAGACVYLQVFSPRLKAVNPRLSAEKPHVSWPGPGIPSPGSRGT